MIPARFSPPPFPCNVDALREWLIERHAFPIPADARMTASDKGMGILGYVQGRYARVVPTENEGGIPWPSEVWAAVVKWEREAGQPSLFEGIEAAS